MKLMITAPMLKDDMEKLRGSFADIVYYPWTENGTGTGYREQAILKLLEEEKPDALISELDEITARVLQEYDKLQLIGDCRANPANIDISSCNERKIPVICTPARNAQAVAELLVGLLINFYRNVQPAVKWMKDGKWEKGILPYSIFMGNELCEKQVGFVGFGAVGRTTAQLLKAFGCEISYYDPYVEAKEHSYVKKDLEAIFTESDIVSIHLPVLDSTKGMIGEKLIDSMKKDAVFVNTARSAVIDSKALLKALEEKRIRGAVLDVLDHEPPTEEDLRFAQLENVLVTPHICGASYEVANHQSHIISDRILQWIQKKDPEKVLFNPQILQG